MNARRKLQLTERLRIVMHGLARLYACGVGPGPEGEIIDRQGVSIDARLLQIGVPALVVNDSNGLCIHQWKNSNQSDYSLAFSLSPLPNAKTACCLTNLPV